jgi:hypothetical protein
MHKFTTFLGSKAAVLIKWMMSLLISLSLVLPSIDKMYFCHAMDEIMIVACCHPDTPSEEKAWKNPECCSVLKTHVSTENTQVSVDVSMETHRLVVGNIVEIMQTVYGFLDRVQEPETAGQYYARGPPFWVMRLYVRCKNLRR